MLKNIPKIIESDSQIQDKCSWWFNTKEGVIYRYDDTKESWVIIASSDADKQAIINSAVNQSVYTANLYSDQQNNELESELRAELHKLEKKVYPTCRYARHGRIDISNCNGVDYILVPCNQKCQLLYVTNNYLKQFCEKATFYDLIDKYNFPVYQICVSYDYDDVWPEKTLSDTERNNVSLYVSYQNESKEDPQWEADFARKTFAVKKADIMRAFSKWYSDNECILKQYDRSQMPADDIKNYQWYIYTKSITTRHNKMGKKTGFGNYNHVNTKHLGVYHPNKKIEYLMTAYSPWNPVGWGASNQYNRTIFHEVKTWNGIRQFVWCGWRNQLSYELGYTPENTYTEYFPAKMRYIKVDAATHEKYKNDETKVCVSPAVLSRFPYMVFKNPFRGNRGGIIPIIDGKLRIEYAKECKNRSLLLVSNNYQKLDFDENGVCKQPLNPNFVEIFLPMSAKRKIGMYGYFKNVGSSWNSLLLRHKNYYRRCIQFFKKWRVYYWHRSNDYYNSQSILNRKHPNQDRNKKSTNPPYHIPRCVSKRKNYINGVNQNTLWAYNGWQDANKLPILRQLGNKMSLFEAYINQATYEIGRYIKDSDYLNFNINILQFSNKIYSGSDSWNGSKKVGFQDGSGGLQRLLRKAFNTVSYKGIESYRRYVKYNFLYGNSDTFSMYKCNPYYPINTITLQMQFTSFTNSDKQRYSFAKRAYLTCKPGIVTNI